MTWLEGMELPISLDSHMVFVVSFFLFNHLWMCSCFHQPGIQRWLEVKLLQEHWFDSSFLPTTYLKTKGCQSLLFKTVTFRGREEGGRDLSWLCLFSTVSWQPHDSISGASAHPSLAHPPQSRASESEFYLDVPVVLSLSFSLSLPMENTPGKRPTLEKAFFSAISTGDIFNIHFPQKPDMTCCSPFPFL